MRWKIAENEKGAVLVVAIIILLVMALTIPLLVTQSRQDAKDTVRTQKKTNAFHLCEAGIDQGIWKLQESQTVWTNAKTGTTVTDYDGTKTFSITFSNGRGGEYNVKFSSGPSSGQVTILAKGRDATSSEIRAVQSVMTENGLGNAGISAKKTSSFGAATSVEWGPVISKTSINSGGKTHPRLYSAGDVVGMDANGSSSPNTDGVQWWSYKQDLPPDPQFNFAAYKASATAYGAAPNGCGNGNSSTYYRNGNATFKGCGDSSGKVYYIEGNADFQAGSGGNYIKGTLIINGDFSITGNGGANGTLTNFPVPSTAWEEYGNDWAYYKSNFDASCPHATYAAAVTAEYAPTTLTKTITDVLIYGFIYTGGSQGLTGGGNANMVGSLYSANNTSMTTSNCTLYYDPAAVSLMKTTNVLITRSSWKELTGVSWP